MIGARVFFVAVSSVMSACPALADFASSIAMQTRLKQDGFYSGEVDGRFGPASRRAMQQYASDRGIPANMSSVFDQMAAEARGQRRDASPEEIEATIKAVKDSLMDPYSADVQIEWAYPTKRGWIAVCGRVNAKNGYGAYVGFKWFNVPVARVPTSDADQAVYLGLSPLFEDLGGLDMCLIGTYVGAESQ